MERKRKEALEVLRQQEITDLGLDYERVRSWDYSAEDVERYNKKMEEKKENYNPGFADYNDVANRKYKKLVREIKPDLESYNYQKKVVEAINSRVGESAGAGFDDTNILLDDQLVRPSDHNLEKLSNSIVQSQANSAKRQKASIKKANRDINKTGEVTYINDRNAHFNRKIARAYDPYTKEIRDSFERGTAL
ncbi:Pre-mRNA-splicing factor syf2 [Zancudomyces culisetae]|uniref:Pre-mRNA-splicing factor SYF2 n=1 Tax=Zancudomyces culisetae TaxID=1213189 RepID=A0A1R1PXT3_ZANCU|nr:Pre-mRNA-splicing factor syf2 [Zancudomyces culisetae]|eukprot:OMH85784.1 Pre-mRNA-splicing factor syf2 [Zancudomyces culisetae]